MAVVSRDKLLESIRERLGDDTSDQALALIEDVTDTLNDFESRTNDSTNWKSKYEENDKNWREKYKARFFSAKDDEDDGDDDGEEAPKSLTYDELFKEETK